MLPMVPIRRKSMLWILGTALWNFILCLPFLIAFFILTEINDDGVNNQAINGNDPDIYHRYNAKGTEIFPDGTQRFTDGSVLLLNGTRFNSTREDGDQNCFFIPWGYANWARWGFLALCVYWLAIIPFNMWVLKKRKNNIESRWTPWLTMADCLVWVYSLGQWIYAVMALSNRGACPDGKIRALIWANVWIAAMLFAIELLIGAILLLIAVRKLIKNLRHEIAETNKLVAQQPQQTAVKKTTERVVLSSNPVTESVVVTQREPIIQDTRQNDHVVVVTNETVKQETVLPLSNPMMRQDSRDQAVEYDVGTNTHAQDIRAREAFGSRSQIQIRHQNN